MIARFPALTSFDFRRLFANGFFTTASRWAQVLARGWLVHDLTDGSATAVGWVTFASFFPFIVVGPVVGALADRLDRRLVLIYATIFGIVGATVLAAITIADVVEVWHVILLAFMTGSAQAATVPTRQALIANVVPEDHLLNAVALGGISQHGSRVVGPLFGAAFLARFGPGSVFVLSAVLLSLGLIEVFRLRIRLSPVDRSAEVRGAFAAVGRIRSDLAAAGRYVRADVRLLTIIGLVAVHCSFTMAFDSMMPTLAENVGGSAGLYSSILIGLGTGALIGTLGVSQLRKESFRGTIFLAVGLGSGAAMIVLGTASTRPMVLVGAGLAGLTQASYMTMSAALIHKVVADDFRARVMSFYIMIAAGHMAFMNLGFGRLADGTDVRLLLVGPGVVWTVVFIVASFFIPEVRSIIRSGTFSNPTRTPVAA
ncbi:MAG: MFS family permease [Acidimicrobiales bacterium]